MKILGIILIVFVSFGVFAAEDLTVEQLKKVVAAQEAQIQSITEKVNELKDEVSSGKEATTKAQSDADVANNKATAAQSSANTAQSTATAAKTAAKAAQDTADIAKSGRISMRWIGTTPPDSCKNKCSATGQKCMVALGGQLNWYDCDHIGRYKYCYCY